MGLIAAARASEGSIANVRAVNEGRVTSGLAQADIVAAAHEGTGPFKGNGKAENLRAIAALFPETVHIVVFADSPIKAIKDLKGKRVSIDAAGSGTNATARLILTAFRLSEKRVKFSFENAERSLEMMQKGDLDAFFFVGGAPLGVVEELAGGFYFGGHVG
jgi:TRAP transporter TAXI family solute receptor